MLENYEAVLYRREFKNGMLGEFRLFKDGKQIFHCNSLEPLFMENKCGVSCIPEGVYKCSRDINGRFKYYKLEYVKNRSNIEIHVGNFIHDTKGCILLGNANYNYRDRLKVSLSDSLAVLNTLLLFNIQSFNLRVYYLNKMD